MAPVAVFASKAMMPLLIIAVAVAVIFSNDRVAGFRQIPGYLWVGFGLLGAWGVLSALWSITPNATLRTAAAAWLTIYAGLYLIGSVSSGQIRSTHVRRALFWGCVFAFALLIFEQITAGWLMRNAKNIVFGPIYEFPNVRMGYVRGGSEVNLPSFYINGTVVITLIIWPLAAYFQRDGAWGKLALLALAVLWIVISYGSAAALLAILFGAFVVAAASWRHRLMSTILALSVAGSILIAPLLPQVLLKTNDLETLANKLPTVGIPFANANRLYIWEFVGEKISDRAIAGWGLRASRAVPGADEKYTIRLFESDGRKRPVIIDYYIPLHPHNQPLQIWLELGAIGALIVAITLGLFLWRSTSTPTIELRVQWQMGPIGAALIYGYLSFGAWQSWWLATMFLSAAIMTISLRRPEPSSVD